MNNNLMLFFLAVLYLAESCDKKRQSTDQTPEPTTQLVKWNQKLYQDSCTLSVAIRFDSEGGEGDRSLETEYDNYLYGLSKSVEYDRFIIRELKRK